MFGSPRMPIGKLKDRSVEEKLKLSLNELGLKVRTVNVLEGDNVLYVEDLLECTADDLLAIPNFGPATLKEVLDKLAELGFERLSNDES